MVTEYIKIDVIARDPEIQAREEMNQDTLTQYSEDWIAGIEFPPVLIFFDGQTYWLADGWHRVQSAEDAGLESVPAEIRQGTRDDALWEAVAANKQHDTGGQRRTNADKRRAVEMALRSRPDLSDPQLAKHVGVHSDTVRNHRKRIFRNSEDSRVRTVTREVNGQTQTYTMQVDGIGKVEPEPNPTCRYCGQRSPDRFHLCESHRFVCEVCDEVFDYDKEVWHCPGCAHHWLLDVEECKNCRDYERLDDGTVRRIVTPEAGEESEDEVESGEAEEIEILPDVYSLDSEPATVKSKSRPVFNKTNDMVEWAWWTWNPVTGCEHNCVYCYARDIANRFYPEKFTPTFRPERLEAPRDTTYPEKARTEIGWRNVFVCSMADLFGRWVPDQWIEDVFTSCRKSPQWNYLFLTKFPLRYESLRFPDTAWVGTSVDEQRRVANAEKAFAKVKAPIKWLSVEPLREPLKFTRLDLFDWVVIGGQSASSGAPEFLPPFEWVADIVVQSKAAGCQVYIKPNIGFDGQTRPREYPSDI
jgi:protein gp37